MIYTIQNQKGGVGKTTLSVHLADGLARRAKRVLLVDSDPQGSARDWAAAREDELEFAVVGLDRPTIHRDLSKMAADYDDVVIDGPPRVTDLARSAIIAAHWVIIPVQPSPYDVWAVQDVVELVKEAQVYNEKLIATFVINRRIVNSAIGRDVVNELQAYELPILDAQICQRVAFAESAAIGRTVLETAGHGPATREIAAFVDELVRGNKKQ